jgi:hypothetical protein
VSVYKKLQEARVRFHKLSLKKSGENKFAGYKYFELGDFLPSVQDIFYQLGLCGVVAFDKEIAWLTIVDTDKPEDRIAISSPMGSAALKGCHEVQQIGAVETYQRRYLWGAAMEIVENDILDATSGSEEPKKPAQSLAKKPVVKAPKDIVKSMLEAAVNDGNMTGVYREFYETGLDQDQQKAVWALLDKETKQYLTDERKKRTNG